MLAMPVPKRMKGKDSDALLMMGRVVPVPFAPPMATVVPTALDHVLTVAPWAKDDSSSMRSHILGASAGVSGVGGSWTNLAAR